MAGIANGKKPESLVKHCNICLEGGVHSNIKAALVKELIKYVMYERQQIPVPFDHLKKTSLPSASSNPEVASRRNGKKRCLSQTMEEKKKIHVTSNLTELLCQIESVFSIFPELDKVLLILGSTVVSPKETFLINLPLPMPDVEITTEKSCVKSLFRQIIGQDILGDVKQISPTNMTVMVQAPRNSGLSWFKPKPKFKAPERGRKFVYNITCQHQIAGPHDMSCDVSEIEISGIEPLEGSVLSDMGYDEESSATESSDENWTQGNRSSDSRENYSSGSSSSSSIADCTVLRVSQMDVDEIVPLEQNESDIIWYQAPLLVKGYKEKLSQKRFV